MLSRAFGVRYGRADSDDVLECALAEALEAETAAVIEVRPADARS
jgi:hypothetical protein